MSEPLVFVKLNPIVKGVLGNFQGWRAKVPGGWLFTINNNGAVTTTFYPDPEHKWDGGSLP